MSFFKYLRFVFVFSVLNACQPKEPQAPLSSKTENLSEPQLHRDWEDIQADGVLNAIAIYNSTSYFLYRGEPMGFEFELLSLLAKDLNLELNITIAENQDELFEMLNRGEGDIVAHGLTITEDRKKIVNFTQHHYLTHQVLVQRKPSNWRHMPRHRIQKALVSDPVELIGDTVHIRWNSSYYERMQHLISEIGGDIYIDTIPGSTTTEEIIQMVVDGKIDYTVADYNIASINQTFYPILDIDTQVSFSQRIAWAVRKNSPELLQKVNHWMDKVKNQSAYSHIYNKYFRHKKSIQRRVKSDFFSKNSGKISPYDDLIKENAAALNWDWRLLSAQIYQESRFDPKATAWTGAEGLMQLMPTTAKELGLDSSMGSPAENLRAGTAYLKQLTEKWMHIPDSTQRIKFVLASYNCGLGHVLDAQRLAKAQEEDPNIWDDNVEDYILKLASPQFYNDPLVRYGFVRGREPYLYVKEIFLRYEHYRQFIAR
jgi:membrane-bound lytic murein transglycosylase F